MSGTNRGVGGSLSPQVVRPLSPEDLSILALETETVAGHTCKVIVLGDRIDPDLLRASIASRLHEALPLRMRLCAIDGEPCWGLDPELNLDEHVVLVEDSEQVDMAGLRVTVARIFEQRLDRSRPLWRIDVIPRLTDGGSALLWRFHHALVDGATAMRIAHAALWDDGLNADGRADGRPESRPAGRHVSPAAQQRLGGLRAVAREAPHPWQRSPFNGHIDARRAVAFTSVELAGVRSVARAAGGATVNDAVLTIVAGGLRRWLESRHGHLGAVRVKVPVSLHDPRARGDNARARGDNARARGDNARARGDNACGPGNRDSFFCLDLPLAPADPMARLRAVRRATRVRKESHDAQQLDALMRRLAHAPQLRSFAERVLAHPRSFALSVSNVRGPRGPVHVLGAPVRALYSIAEIRDHHALRIAVVSLEDTLNFGLTTDPTLLPDVDQLADHMQAEVTALLAGI
jgi:diacylglycerol O-acyltransferase / wax synthase